MRKVMRPSAERNAVGPVNVWAVWPERMKRAPWPTLSGQAAVPAAFAWTLTRISNCAGEAPKRLRSPEASRGMQGVVCMREMCMLYVAARTLPAPKLPRSLEAREADASSPRIMESPDTVAPLRLGVSAAQLSVTAAASHGTHQ